MGQAGLPFIMGDGKIYESKGFADVSCLSGQSGLDKRQATAQLTIFAAGKKLKPLIFCCKALRIDKKAKYISGASGYRSFSNRMPGAMRRKC